VRRTVLLVFLTRQITAEDNLPRQLLASSCFERDCRFRSSWPRAIKGIRLQSMSSRRYGVCQNVDSIPLQYKPARPAAIPEGIPTSNVSYEIRIR